MNGLDDALLTVIPAQAGIQESPAGNRFVFVTAVLDSRLHGNDGKEGGKDGKGGGRFICAIALPPPLCNLTPIPLQLTPNAAILWRGIQSAHPELVEGSS